MKNEQKMKELIQSLKGRGNESYKFFERLLIDFNDSNKASEAKKRLSSCFAITQYANFTYEEEKLLGEIIEENLQY